MDPMLERRLRLLRLGRDPGMLPGLGGEMPPAPPMGMPPGMAPPTGPGMPPPMGAGMPMPPMPMGAAPPGAQGMAQGGPPGPGMMPPPMGGAPVPPGPGMQPPPPSMPPGGAPPTGPGLASYAPQPPQQQPPAWFPGPPMPKPRPPPRRRSAVEELGDRMGQPPAPPVSAHEPEPARVPQPVGDASGYDPTAVYGGARGSTREMPRDTSLGGSAGLMDWIAQRLGWGR